MTVVVLGAGVIGTTSAYELAKAGHKVIVIDRQPSAALETSFANAGEVSFGYCSPWAAPGIPLKALRWLFMDHAPLILKPRMDAAMISWVLQMLRNCTAGRYAINKSRMLRVAEYSRRCLANLRSETAIPYDERMRGTLQLFRTRQQLDSCAKDVAVLKTDGIAHQLLDAAGCILVEPALARVRAKITGGLLTPNDETGDCYKFTVALAEKAAKMGVEFRFGTSVEAIDSIGAKLNAVRTDRGDLKCDKVLVALGSYSPLLMKTLAIQVPVYPVKGYSLTIPITDISNAPLSTVMDETYKIAITRLGDRIRVGGMAEISGYSSTLDPRRRRTLEHSVDDLFPAGDMTKASFWAGLRPMTPDGTPIIGATSISGLYLNTGHGTLGWTMSAGSAKLIADIMSDREPEIDHADLSLSRY